ncbi:hypothetical protein MKX08_000343 [Trichoderma sp. CBMAI-0020]|nr:hypothetical protein MKX08_000343 [Trichoderma sp. CBMAI-0020]
MDQPRPLRQFTGHLSARPATASPSPQLRPQPSFRDRFWSTSSSNYHGEDNVIPEPQNTAKKGPYVPRNAASGFSKTATSREQQLRRKVERQPSKDSVIDVYASSPLSELAAGHLYTHTGSEAKSSTTDFADFMTTAQNEERLRRAANAVHARSQYRDSGYYSPSTGGRTDGRCSPSVPSSASAAGLKKLKSQPSMRTFGQRIADYIKPPRDESLPPMRRKINDADRGLGVIMKLDAFLPHP